MTMPQSPSSALPALCRDDALRPRPAAYRREAFPGCESFHLPASEVADRMHSDGLRAEHCAGGRYGPRPAMKPGVDWQDRLHGIEMFQKYPNGPVGWSCGRSWKAACNSCQSLFEPIELSSSQSNHASCSSKAAAACKQMTRINQMSFSFETPMLRRVTASATASASNVSLFAFATMLAASRERRLFCISPSSIKSGTRVSASRATPSSASPNAYRCEAFAIKCQDAGRERSGAGSFKVSASSSGAGTTGRRWPSSGPGKKHLSQLPCSRTRSSARSISSD